MNVRIYLYTSYHGLCQYSPPLNYLTVTIWYNGGWVPFYRNLMINTFGFPKECRQLISVEGFILRGEAMEWILNPGQGNRSFPFPRHFFSFLVHQPPWLSYQWLEEWSLALKLVGIEDYMTSRLVVVLSPGLYVFSDETVGTY